jgi:hypothetical protein
MKSLRANKWDSLDFAVGGNSNNLVLLVGSLRFPGPLTIIS